MELNENDRRGDYSTPGDDSRRRTPKGFIFVSKKKAVCFIVTVVVLVIVSAIVGTVISSSKNSIEPQVAAHQVTNRSRKTTEDRNSLNKKQPWKKYRLPRDIMPINYDITIKVNMSSDQFIGKVKIQIFVKIATQFIVLHSEQLKYVRLGVKDRHRRNVERLYVKSYGQYLVIKLAHILRQGDYYVLEIVFKAPFKSYPSRGLYKLRNKPAYDPKTGKWITQKDMAVTLFAPVSARRNFPCFDEPDMKARFNLLLIHTRGYTAVSNMPLNAYRVTRRLAYSRFSSSLKMSTYLVNYAIFDYTHTETRTSNGTAVRIWSPKHTSKKRDYALHVAKETLTFYEGLFRQKYPISKLGKVTLPSYGVTAMENWGLINYVADRLLLSVTRPLGDMLLKKQAIAILVSHEIVHQWFGNLVTLKWWDDVFVQEGGSTYLEYFGASYVEPSYNIMDQFYNIEVREAMKEDSLQTAKCIAQAVRSSAKAARNFNYLAYRKGAAIIRMLHKYVGDKAFFDGLRLYLKRFAYGNAAQEDFWNAFTENSDIDGTAVMRPWTKQPGFPVITTSEVKPGQIFITQRRFIASRGSSGAPSKFTWTVPITYVTSKNPTKVQHYLLPSRNSTLNIDEANWYKLNYDASGYYIVNYDIKNWNGLMKQLKEDHSVFSILDRASMIKDAFTMVEEGLLPYKVVLDLTTYLKKETEWIPWQYAKHYVSEMIMRLPTRSKTRLKLLGYFKGISKHLLDTIGWKSKATMRERFLQETAISAALNADDKQAIKTANKIFKDWMHNQTYIPENIAKVIYFYGVLNGGENEWQIVYRRYGFEWRSERKAALLNALGASANPWTLNKFLRAAKKNYVLPLTGTINAVADGSRLGRSVAWRFIKSNWDDLPASYNVNYVLRNYVQHVAEKFSTQYQYDDVSKVFRKEIGERNFNDNVKDLLMKIKRNVEWMNTKVPEIEAWLDGYLTQ